MHADAHPAKIRALIVDDEPLARSNLAVLLRTDPEIGIVGECGSGAEALGEIRVANPDLLFLDVQMPECDGFDVLELLGRNLPPAIVFVTAYDQYALRAFEAGALDYLLKPFDNARFALALSRAKQRIRLGRDRTQRLERVVIKNAGQLCFVKSQKSTGSKRPTTTRACTSDRKATSCVVPFRTWKRIWIRMCFAGFIAPAS